MSNRWKVVSTLSPSLNSDWLGDIKLFLVENLHILIHYSFKYFSGYVKQRHGMVIFQYLLISFYMCRNYICFFPFNRKFCTFKTWFNYWFKWITKSGITTFQHPNTYHDMTMGFECHLLQGKLLTASHEFSLTL